MTYRSVLIGVVACWLTVAPASGQRGDQPAPPRDEQPDRQMLDGETPVSRERVRQRLASQLEWMRTRELELERALQALDEGRPLSEVTEQVSSPERRRSDPRPPESAPDSAPRAGAPVDPKELPEIMRFIRENRPELAEKLGRLREEDPEAFRRQIEQVGPRVRRLLAEAEGRPDRWKKMGRMRELRERSRRLAYEITTADPEADTSGAREELRATVEEGVDLHIQSTRRDIERLRERLHELEEDAERLHNERERVVDELYEAALAGDEKAPPGRRPRSDRRRRSGDGDRGDRPD